MSTRVKVLIAFLLVAVVLTGFLPQMALAHRLDEAVSQGEALLSSSSDGELYPWTRM